MDKRSTRGHMEIPVDTSKFESWPLLRPDELAATPTKVLQASAKDLDLMCRQRQTVTCRTCCGSMLLAGRDPITDYARRQHERTTTILLERAAQARVQALLAGTEFVGRDSLFNEAPATLPPEAEKAPSYEASSMTRALAEDYARPLKDRSSVGCAKSSNTDDDLTVPCGVGPTKGDKVNVSRPSLRSPPRIQSSRGPSTVLHVAALVVKDEGDIEQAKVSQGHGFSCGKVTDGSPGRQSIGGDGQVPAIDGQYSHATEPKACSSACGGRAVTQTLSKQGLVSSGVDHANGAFKTVPAEAAAAPGDKGMGQHEPARLYGPAATLASATQSAIVCHDNNREKQPTSSCINRAVRDNWGTVFVVGGGRRRRRTVVRQRSVEVDETPAARRAQVEKDRQERRKASLRRLMARKEQRALQQRARRQRRAAAAKHAAATAAATANTTSVVPAECVGRPSLCGVKATQPLLAGAKQGARQRERERATGMGSGRVGVVGEKQAPESPGGDTEIVVGNSDSTILTSNQNSVRRHGYQHHPVEDSNISFDERRANFAAAATSVTMAETNMEDATSGSSSESVSGGDSSDDDHLSVDEVEALEKEEDDQEDEDDEDEDEDEEDEDEKQTTPKGITGGTSNNTSHQAVDEPESYRARDAIKHLGFPREHQACGENHETSGTSGHGVPLDCYGGCRSPLRQAAGPGVDAAETKATQNRGDASNVPDSATERRSAHGNGIVEAGSTPEPEDGGSHRPSLANTEPFTTPKPLFRENVVDQQSMVAVALNEHCGEGESTRTHPNAAAAIPAPFFSLESRLSADGDPATSEDNRVAMDKEKAGTTDPGPDEWEEVGGQRYGPSDDDSDSDNTEGSGATLELQGPLHVRPLAETREVGHGSHKGSTGCGELGTVTQKPPKCDAGETKQGRNSGLVPSANDIVVVSDVDLAAPRRPTRLLLSAPASASPRLPVPFLSRGPCSPSGSGTGNDCVAVGVEHLLPEPPAPRLHRPELHSPPAAGHKEGTGDNRNAHSTPKECRELSKQSYRAGNVIVDNTSARFTVEPRHAFTAVPQGRRQRRNRSLTTPPVTGTGEDDSKATCLQAEVPGTPGVSASGDAAGHFNSVEKVRSSHTLATYMDCFPRFAAILSAHHNGRALTRQADCRSLSLTSKNLSRGRAGTGGSAANRRGLKGLGLTGAEEEACFHWQWKLYAIHVRVIKDYATVFSYGDGWSGNGTSDDSNSLVYSGDSSALHYRVNSKARPEVYNIVTDVLNNRCNQWEELPTGLGLKTTWNLLWTWSKPHIQYSSLLTWQKVNHFPNSRELTRKDLLNKHLSRFMAPGGRLAKEFHIMPQTFVLPHEFTLFVSAFTSSSGRSRQEPRKASTRGGGGGIDHVGSSDEEETWTKPYGAGGSRTRVGKRGNLWIMKPVGMSRGRGIRLIDDIKDICYADKVVLQRYIGNPLLLDGYKFDLRLYVLVTSFNKLEAFIYKEGFARLSTHRYEKGDISNRFIHLTNSSIQRLNEAGAARDSPLNQAKTSEAGGTKTTLSYLWRRLATSGVDVGALWAEICSVVVKSLVCVESSIPNQPNRQAGSRLFGYDVLIDDRLRPWLIEVNTSPSMARDTHVDRQVKEALIFETVHLIDPLPFDRQKLVDILGRRLNETEHLKTRAFKQRHYPHHHQQAFDTPEAQRDARAGDNLYPSPSAKASTSREHQRPRRTREEADLESDLDQILRGRRPRQVGELPARMGNFVRLCPGTAAHRRARRLRRKVIRPQPGDDDDLTASKR
ncbi:unnamed protein product [Ectocarpus fasciculatus]